MDKVFLLALDAGHGLGTPGKRCLKALDANQTREWVLNDRVCRFIAQRAGLYEGFETLRVDDPTGSVDVPLPERCRRANEAGAHLYLSNHHNAGINGGSGGGVVAYCVRGGTRAKLWRDRLYEAVVEAGNLRGNRTDPLGEKNYDVLVMTDMSAVLMEYGFMDSATDVPVILSEEYARQVGYAVADAIAREQGLPRKQAQTAPVQAGGYVDVPGDAWYADAVAYCRKEGLMLGMDETHFVPHSAVTRAQLAVVAERLHRLMTQPG